MKKLTLLLTLLCAASALKGMEPIEPQQRGSQQQGYWNLLPRDVKVIIMQSLNSGRSIDEVIKNIKTASLVSTDLNRIINEMYGNQKGFTALVHILADKFNNTCTWWVVHKFKTPASREYERLENSLREAIKENNINEVIDLIKQGADVNAINNYFETLLLDALDNVQGQQSIGGLEEQDKAKKIIKILLAHGAQVSEGDLLSTDVPEIKQLLEQAIKK